MIIRPYYRLEPTLAEKSRLRQEQIALTPIPA
jgi:hypothetical protein